MADLYYYETDYIDDKYFVYTADASMVAGPYIVEGYFEPDYFVDYSSRATLYCDAEILTGVTVEASGTWSSAASFSVTALRIKSSAVALTSAFSESATALRIQNSAVALFSEFTESALVGRIQQAAADFGGLFTPGISVIVYKNHTAVIESITTISAIPVANRAISLALETIGDLNSQAVKTAVVDSTMASSFSQTTNATKLVVTSASSAITASLSADVYNVQFASAALESKSQVFVSRNAYNRRPIVLDGYPAIRGEAFKFGSYSNRLNSGSTKTLSYPSDVRIGTSTQFVLEGWLDSGSYSRYSTSLPIMGIGTTGVAGSLANIGANQVILYQRHRQVNTAEYYSLRLLVKDGSGATVYFDSVESTDPSVYHNYIPNEDAGFEHYAITRDASKTFRVYKNGTEVISGQVTTIGTSTEYRAVYHNFGGGLGQYSYWDEISLRKGTSSISTGPITDDPSTQVFLFHFEEYVGTVPIDDTSNTLNLTYSQQAALTTTAAIATQANANTKQGLADLSSPSSLTVNGAISLEGIAELSATANLTAVIGKLESVTSLDAGTFTLDAVNSRTREFDIAALSMFTPSIIANATVVGEIALVGTFSVLADVESWTNAYADLSSEFSVTAPVDGIARIGQAALTSSTALSSNSGKLKDTTVAITGAFDATVNVEYFEGTALLAPMTATMSATANRIVNISKTISSASSLTANVRVAVRDLSYPIKTKALIHFDSTSYIDEFGGTITNGGSTQITGKFSNAQGYPVSAPSSIRRTDNNLFTDLFLQDNWTVDFWFKPRDLAYLSTYTWPATGILALSATSMPGTYQSNGPDTNLMIGWTQTTLVSDNSASGHFWFGTWGAPIAETGNFSYTYNSTTHAADNYRHIAVTYENLGVAYDNFYNIRVKIYVDGVLAANRTSVETAATLSTSNLVMMPTIYRIPDRDTNGSYTQSFKGWIDELRFQDNVAYSGNFTPPSAAYNLPLYYKAAEALIESSASISAVGISVVFIEASLFAGTFTQNTLGGRVRYTGASVTASSTFYANAGKRVAAQAAISAQAEVSATGDRTREASAQLTATASINCLATRVRYNSSALAVTATVASTPVKKTGVVLAVSAEFSQSLSATRVRYADTAFTAIATELTVAAKNATGTVTLEAAFTSEITAQKITDRPQSLFSVFTMTPNTAQGKIVGFDAAMDIEFAQDTIGDRIQPAGSDVTVTATFNCDTTNSKIAGTTVNTTAEFSESVSTLTSRIRSTSVAANSQVTVVTTNQVLRLANAALTSQFSILVSPTFIVRITADFTAFNTQLTVGDVINIDPYYQLRVLGERRTIVVEQETRGALVLPEDRVNIIQGYRL